MPFEIGAEISTIVYEDNPDGVKRVAELVKQADKRSGRKAQNWSDDADKAAALLAPLHDFVARNTIPALDAAA